MVISVIIPVYQQWHLVPALLDDLARQTLPQDTFEVVLVDNGSPQFAPPTYATTNVRVTTCATPGSYAARNAGAALARGDLLAFTDADCRPEPSWLAAIRAAATEHPGALLAGRVRMQASSAHPDRYEIYDLVRGIPQRDYVSRGYAATANLTVARDTFEALNGFNPARLSGGDAEFCRRAGAAGHPMTYIHAASVTHPARSSWAAVVEKARRIKGAQLRHGPATRRAAWVFRTLLPPVRLSLRLLREPDFPLPQRWTAVGVALSLWPIEISEMFRLLSGGAAERR